MGRDRPRSRAELPAEGSGLRPSWEEAPAAAGLGPVRGKGKITGARRREGLRDREEGRRCDSISGAVRAAGEKAPRPPPKPHHPPGFPPGVSSRRCRRLVRAPQAGAGGATEGRAEGGPGRGAVRLAPGGGAGGRWPRPSSGSRGARSLPDVSPARGASSGRSSCSEQAPLAQLSSHLHSSLLSPTRWARACDLGRGGGGPQVLGRLRGGDPP